MSKKNPDLMASGAIFFKLYIVKVKKRAGTQHNCIIQKNFANQEKLLSKAKADCQNVRCK